MIEFCLYNNHTHFFYELRIIIVWVNLTEIKRHCWAVLCYVRFQHPFTCCISGPSGSGKSVFVEKLLEHRFELIAPPVERVIWSLGVAQPALEKRWTGRGVAFVEGLPDLDRLCENSLIIIDDQMSETDVSISNLFTKGSHHNRVSVIYIVQNLFGKNKYMRTISLNSHYLALFKNPRDSSQSTHLGKQMYPGKLSYFQSASVFYSLIFSENSFLLPDFYGN